MEYLEDLKKAVRENISEAEIMGACEAGNLAGIRVVHRAENPDLVDVYETYFVDHTAGVYPTAASGSPWNAASMAVKGDLIADLTEDLAAEQKARVTYDNILRLSDDPDVNDVIKFLRAREIVHFQRFGEAKRTRWRVTKRAAEQNSRKSSKMVACGCLTLKSMVMGAHPLTAIVFRFPQCGHPSSERSCHSVRQSKGRA